MAQRIQHRRGTAAAWTTADPILAAGEFGLETDTGKVKLGDGVTAWTSRAYFLATAACRVKRVAAYTPANGVVTAIPWDGEWYDTHSFHDNVTNNTRLTVPASAGAGLYMMTGVWVPDGPLAVAARVLCRIKVNGVEVGGSEIEGGAVFASPVLTLDHNLIVGDYVEFCSFVSGTGTTPLNLANTTFSLRKVGQV